MTGIPGRQENGSPGMQTLTIAAIYLVSVHQMAPPPIEVANI